MTARCPCGAADDVFPSTVQRRLCLGCQQYTCAACEAVVTYVRGEERPESLYCKRCVGKELRT